MVPDGTRWYRLALPVLALALAGCNEVGEYGPAHIVAVHCEPKKGSEDCTTAVELADGRRALRAGVYGAVGDTFQAAPFAEGRLGIGSWR